MKSGLSSPGLPGVPGRKRWLLPKFKGIEMRFFNLGASEFLLIIIFAILAVGPKDALRLAGQVRDIVRSVQSTFNELTNEVTRAASEAVDTATDKENES
jgi:Sec-independent protein translocase protein TatA